MRVCVTRSGRVAFLRRRLKNAECINRGVRYPGRCPGLWAVTGLTARPNSFTCLLVYFVIFGCARQYEQALLPSAAENVKKRCIYMNKIVPLPHKNNREKVYNMVIHVRKLPFGGDFLAINLCGLIFALRDLSPEELNHERIHTAQQRELLFLPFFLWYAAEWLVLMVRYRNRMEAYYRIRFEREAYRHQAEPDYLARRRHYHYLS